MSNSHNSRHMACRTCRERKVRCDGGQPACQKCQRAREECIYVPASKQTKAELAESLEMVQERLARAEATLASQNILNGRHRPSSIASSLSVPLTDRIATSPVQPPLSPASTDYSMITRNVPGCNPNILWSNAMPFTTNSSIDSNISFSFPPDDGTLSSMGGEMPLGDSSSSAASFPLFANTNEQNRVHGSERRRESYVAPSRLPSRRDVREWNAAQQQSHPSHTETSSPATPNRGDALNHFTVFANTVSSTSADIAGVALTVADYLAWVRKNPEQCREGTIEVFEARVREIAEMATNRMVDTLESVSASQTDMASLGSMVKRFEAAMAREAQEKADYFRSTYDIQSGLDEQRGRVEGLNR